MGEFVEVKPFHLRVISSLFTDLTAGLILLMFTIHDIIVLTITAYSAILFILLSMRIERRLDEL